MPANRPTPRWVRPNHAPATLIATPITPIRSRGRLRSPAKITGMSAPAIAARMAPRAAQRRPALTDGDTGGPSGWSRTRPFTRTHQTVAHARPVLTNPRLAHTSQSGLASGLTAPPHLALDCPHGTCGSVEAGRGRHDRPGAMPGRLAVNSTPAPLPCRPLLGRTRRRSGSPRGRWPTLRPGLPGQQRPFPGTDRPHAQDQLGDPQ